jgi:hypothetical protein
LPFDPQGRNILSLFVGSNPFANASAIREVLLTDHSMGTNVYGEMKFWRTTTG